ncbi:MAG TPA: transcriptional repressor [Candidatus Paceibacterota bacterium]|nr:transcriptional repressor [Candidatus Paceibacterota bacterium]
MKEHNNQNMDVIRKAGFRATKPRLLILSFLRKSPYPVSIEEVIKGVGRKNVDQVTVYRTLEAFHKAGIVAQIDFHHGHAHYELKDKRRDHHHIICTNCEKIEDFTGCGADELADRALHQAKGFATVTDHSVELFGLCKTCAK